MCQLCGQDNGCTPIGGRMGQHRELNKDDWAKLYWFEMHVALPFCHNLLVNARRRNGLNVKTGKLQHGNIKG